MFNVFHQNLNREVEDLGDAATTPTTDASATPSSADAADIDPTSNGSSLWQCGRDLHTLLMAFLQDRPHHADPPVSRITMIALTPLIYW